MIDVAQDLGEQRLRHRHLGQLEHDVTAMAYMAFTTAATLMEHRPVVIEGRGITQHTTRA